MILRLSFAKYVFSRKRNIYLEKYLILSSTWKNLFNLFPDPDINGQITVADFRRAAKKGNVSRLVGWFMVFNATFNNISVIWWQSV